MTDYDWRQDYVICEHLAEHPSLPRRHTGCRVCCEDCYEIVTDGGLPRFLFDETLKLDERPDGLCIGSIIYS